MNNAEVLIKFKADTKDVDSKTLTMGKLIKGNLISSAVMGGLSAVASGIGRITSSIVNLAVEGGFDRALNIEQAEFKLKGLGHSAEEVEVIMDNALKSVKGTAYGLDEAATVAASSVAAGVKPGQELERTLKLIGDAAAISGRSMTDMGAIFNKVAASGKLTGQELNQLTDAGIPMLQLLGDNLGMTTEEVSKLISAGKIGFPEFQDAIEKGMGGAALTMGQTFQGALENTKAAMSRLGKTFMEPFLKGMTPALGTLTEIIDMIAEGTTEGLKEKTEKLGQELIATINGMIEKLTPLIQNVIPILSQLLQALVGALPELLNTLVPLVIDLALDLINALIEALPGLIPPLMNGIIQALMGLLAIVPSLIDVVLKAAVQIIQALAEALPTLLPAIVDALVGTIVSIVDNLPLVLKAGIDLLMGLVKAIPVVIKALVKGLPEIITAFINAAVEYYPALLQGAIDLFMALVEAIPDIIMALVEALPQIIEAIVVGLVEGVPKIIEAVIQIFAKLLGMLGEFGNSIGESVSSFLENIPYYLGVMLGYVVGLLLKFLTEDVPNFINGIIKWVSELPGKIGQIIIDIINWVAQLPGKVISKVMEIKDKIIQTITELPGKMLNIGKNIVHGIWDGINNAKDWVIEKVKKFAKGILDGMKEALGIHSPSTEFALLGKFSVLGYTEALEDMQPEMQKTIDGMFNLQPNVSGSMSSNLSPNFNVVVNNNVEMDPLGQVVNKIKTFSGGAKNDYNWGATI